MLVVVLNIATFDTASGDLMDFILGVVGSLGVMGFDDVIVQALPMWTGWYAEHTYWHPQGGHPNGCFVDDALGDTPEGQYSAKLQNATFPPPSYEIRKFTVENDGSAKKESGCPPTTTYGNKTYRNDWSLGFALGGNCVSAINIKDRMSMLHQKKHVSVGMNILRPGERIFGIRAYNSQRVGANAAREGWMKTCDPGSIKDAFRFLKGQTGPEWKTPTFEMLINKAPRTPDMTHVKVGIKGCGYEDLPPGATSVIKKNVEVIVDESDDDDEFPDGIENRDIEYFGKPVDILMLKIVDVVLHDICYITVRVLTMVSIMYILTAYYIVSKTGRHVGI